MDDLYGNLENYNEENIICELQAENKELKCKLEEYAATLNKLQKEFDQLSSQYKRLETNYSSLMKTAKAEVERKTQAIKNLNLEKDKMVLMSYQNRNTRPSRPRDNSKTPHNKIDADKKSERDDKPRQSEGSRKTSPHPMTERKVQNNSSSTIDLRSKLPSLSNSVNQQGHKSEKNDKKENIIQDRKDDDSRKARASISNRRKSMPVMSLEKEVSSDDDDIDARSASKELKVNSDHNCYDKQKDTDDGFLHDRPKSRISETSSLEERKQGQYEAMSDSHKQRYSRYDKEPSERYRARHKSSHRYRRESPERYASGSREYHDKYYHRSDSDRYRHKGRIHESPPRDKYQRLSKESYRNYERSQYQEHDRLPQNNQERYPTKRRIDHGNDETDSKRLRLEPQFKHYEGDPRVTDDKKVMTKKILSDPLEIQFSTCESPDYNYLEVPHQQVKEIRLTAATKLDDPRTSSQKYVLKKDEGKTILYTVAGQHVDILPLKPIGWGIQPVSVPEALVKLPSLEMGQNAGDICKEIENTANVSMESGEISEHEDVPSHKTIHDDNKLSTFSERKEQRAPVPKADDVKNVDKLRNINRYKIPKLKKSADDKYSIKNSKEDSSTKTRPCDVPNSRNNKDCDIITNIDVDKQLLCLAKGNKLNEDNKIKLRKPNTLSNVSLGNNDIITQKGPCTQDVVQGDLEMSDDNCDDDENLEKISEVAVSTKIEKTTPVNNETPNTYHDKHSLILQSELKESCKDLAAVDFKKTKYKKKSKQRETKSSSKTEDLDKPAKKKDKPKVTSTHIKSKFSELFDDSSSLINLEDLGIAAVPAPPTRLPDKLVPLFDDAVDAADLNTIKSTAVDDSRSRDQKHLSKENESNCNEPFLELCDPIDPEPDDKIGHQAQAITEEDIESIYKNLEPGVPEQEENVQTVVISTGIQPPVLLENEEVVVAEKRELKETTTQDLALEALATSTPHKPWQLHVVAAGTDIKQPDASCDSNTESQMVTNDNTAVMDRSDNTMDSQTNDGNVPDVRIFVKRRRKVAKK